jgi:hypothetical protein
MAWQEEGRAFAGLFCGHQLQLTIGQAALNFQIGAEVLDLEEIESRDDLRKLSRTDSIR